MRRIEHNITNQPIKSTTNKQVQNPVMERQFMNIKSNALSFQRLIAVMSFRSVTLHGEIWAPSMQNWLARRQPEKNVRNRPGKLTFLFFFSKLDFLRGQFLDAARMDAHVALIPTKEPPSGPPRIPRDLPRDLFWRWLEPQLVVKRRADRWQRKVEMPYFWLGLGTLVKFRESLEPQCVVRRRAFFY